MDVVIAGGHGQIGLRLARLLSTRGERVRSIVRNPDHVDDVAGGGVAGGPEKRGRGQRKPAGRESRAKSRGTRRLA